MEIRVVGSSMYASEVPRKLLPRWNTDISQNSSEPMDISVWKEMCSLGREIITAGHGT
jgi:hypothetical protein